MKKLFIAIALTAIFMGASVSAEAHGEQKICKVNITKFSTSSSNGIVLPAGWRVTKVTYANSDIFYAAEADNSCKECKLCAINSSKFSTSLKGEFPIPAGWSLVDMCYGPTTLGSYVFYAIVKD